VYNQIFYSDGIAHSILLHKRIIRKYLIMSLQSFAPFASPSLSCRFDFAFNPAVRALA